MNILQNGTFEAEWDGDHEVRAFIEQPDGSFSEETHEVGNIFNPPGWTTWCRLEGGIWNLPEVRDAWASIDPLRVRSGVKGVMMFKTHGRFDAGFMQTVNVAPGTPLRFAVYAHAWSNHNGDGFPHPGDARWSEGTLVGHGEGVCLAQADIPDDNGDPQNDANGNFRFTVGIDTTGGTNPYADKVVWGEPLYCYNGYSRPVEVEAMAYADTVTAFIRAKVRWAFRHNDAYWDDATLEPTETPPPPSDCENPARVRYDRAYVLLPPDVTRQEAHDLLDEVFDDQQTVGFSADDAGMGCNLRERRVIAVRPDAWQNDLRAFFDTYYPGVVYEVHGETTPPVPPPPTVAEIITQHQQARTNGDAEFYKKVQPRSAKFVLGIQNGRWVLEESPDTLVFYRHWQPDQGEFVKMADGPARWLDQFSDSLEEEVDYIAGVESINEMYATGDIEGIKRMVDFDYRFAEVLWSRFGTAVGAVVATAAVGNPQHGAETRLLIPLAEIAVRYSGWLGYHAYWGSQPDGYTTLDENFKHYSGRALLSWDPEFVAAGYKPRYLFGEGGAVLISGVTNIRNTVSVDGGNFSLNTASLEALAERTKPAEWWSSEQRAAYPEWREPRFIVSTTGDGVHTTAWLNPNSGWKSACANWDHYGQQILQFRAQAKETLPVQEGRVDGLTIFTTQGGSQWDDFDIKHHLDRLADLLVENPW